MKKVISLALCIAMMLCSAFVTSASCEHSYITTEIPATCSERSHTLKTCTICGETDKIYAPLYEEPEGCYFAFEGQINGDVFDVTVSLRNNPGFWANRLTLNYNAQALEVISTAKGDVWTSNASVTVNAESETPYIRFYAENNALANNTKNGLVFSVSFKINGSINDWGLSLNAKSRDNINVDGNTIPFVIIDTATLGYSDHIFDNGIITTEPTNTEAGVIEYTCTECGYIKTDVIPVIGDVNGDGKLNSEDMLLLKRHLAGFTIELSYISKMDVNSDSKVNAKDLLIMKKRFAGLI